MPEPPDILKKIVARKREEVAERAAQRPLSELADALAVAEPVRGFASALLREAQRGAPAIIAEIKRASPSKGVLREDFRPAEIAASYAGAGATCLSVLTDRDFFQGDERYLQEARRACCLPVLRKDFIIDAYQVYEARAIGADCILLIAACLSDAQLSELNDLAEQLDMDVLIEVHSASELDRALQAPGRLIGVNNRDLRNFDVDLATTLELVPRIPSSRLLVTESGIHAREDVACLRAAGVGAFLVGEAFMRAPDPGAALRDLFLAEGVG